jgi:hypothetical protein
MVSCNQPKDPLYPYEALVKGINMDCGIPEIQFFSKIDEIAAKFGTSPVKGIYIGKNLPDELVQENLHIMLNCRVPKTSELGVCSMMGPSYTWVFIINVKKINAH